MAKESITSLDRWYLKGQYVPQLGTEQFAKFAAHGYAMIAGVVSRRINYSVDATATSAYYDGEAGNIVIPGWYLLPEAVSRITGTTADSHAALCLVNGSTIHEALHAKLTAFSLDAAAEYICGHSGTHSIDMAGMIANLVEDLFIESRKSITRPQYAWLTAKNNLLFGDEKIDGYIRSLDAADPQTIINVMIGYKRVDARAKIEASLSPEMVALLRKILALGGRATETDRLDIATEIVSLLATGKCLSSEKPAAGDSADDADSKDGGDDEGEEKKFTIKRGMPSTAKPAAPVMPAPAMPTYSARQNDRAEGAFGAEDIEIVTEEVEESKDDLMTIARAFNAEARKEVSRVGDAPVIEIAGMVIDLKKQLVTVDVSSISRGFARPLPEVAFSNRFATALKQMRTVAPQRGHGKLHGGKVDVLRLHQVAIDNKVFSQKTIDGAGNSDRIEMVILIDASGSMDRYISSDDGPKVTLFSHAVAITNKIFKALRNTDVTIKTFAHTSTAGENRPLLIKIADSATKNAQQKFEAANNIPLRENLDGIIIEEVLAKHFTSDSRTAKVLLVLSDGRPQSPNYGAGVGIPHTMSVIGKGRRAGVKIYSLSLISEVVKTNDAIYGGFNLNASGDLEKVMIDLVTSLVRRK